jgi:penicillin-binding protein 2B
MFRKSPYMNKGAGWLHIIFALLFFIMIAAFLYIQLTGIAKGTDVQKYVADKELNKRKGVLPGKRGTIYSSDNETLAEDVAAYDLYAVLTNKYSKNADPPKHVVDKKQTAAKLSPIIGMSEDDIVEILNKDAQQVEFGKYGRGLTFQQKNEIEALKLPGIFLTEGVKRYYPQGQFAAHTIGYTTQKVDEEGSTAGQFVGQMGLEKQFEEVLKKEDGKVSYNADKQGVILPSVQKDITPPKNGNNVHTTLDSRIQHLIEEALTKADKTYKPESMSVIVAEPKTGKILGMGSRPSFDPNLRDFENSMNAPISDQIEPGSTMKIFTLAAAIDAGKYNGNDHFQSGTYNLDDGSIPIRDHNGGEGWGHISYNEGIQRSSNVAIASLGEKVSPEKMKEYYDNFGLFKKTGIELPGEEDGTLSYAQRRDQLTTMFGQASTITAIQMIQGATAIANDGKMMKPYIVEKITNPVTNEEIKSYEPTVVGQPISKEAAKETRDILETVITAPRGTGRLYAMDGYSIAGKTGTAQIFENGKYLSGSPGNHLLSFIGMVPKDSPEILVYVNVKKPKLEGGVPEAQPVAEIFKHVTVGALQYLKIKPVEKEVDKLVGDKSVKLPDVKDKTVEEAKQQLNDQGLKPILIGNGGKVGKQYPQADSELILGNRVMLLTDGDSTMPDLVGWSISDVMKLCGLLGIQLKIEGEGYVRSQSIAKDEIVAQNSVLTIQCGSFKPGG